MKKIYFLNLLFSFIAVKAVSQKAELHIVNNSGRMLTVKVMHHNPGSGDSRFSLFTVNPHSASVEYFAKTGRYYLKTKAELKDKETIYKKGNPFEVYVGRDGYSVLTITYTITEKAVKNPMEGKEISRGEFEMDIN